MAHSNNPLPTWFLDALKKELSMFNATLISTSNPYYKPPPPPCPKAIDELIPNMKVYPYPLW